MTTELIEVNGTRLCCEMRGSGPPLLFLHGFTLDHRMWRPQLEGLANRFQVIAYDARGFGKSALPTSEPYRHCDDAAALCEHLGVARVVVIGHSIGGHQLLELALIRPDLVAGWASVCMSGLASVPFPEDVMKMFGALRQAARDDGVDAAKRIWRQADWFRSAREVPALAQELDVMLGDYSGWHWTHDNPAQNLKPAAAEQLGSLQARALIISGEHDLPYNELIAQKVAAAVPAATSLHLANAGHMANLEQPEAVNRAIAELAERCL